MKSIQREVVKKICEAKYKKVSLGIKATSIAMPKFSLVLKKET